MPNVSPHLVTGLLLLGMAVMLLPGIDHGLWAPDETWVAGVCADMNLSHDYVIPRLNGQPFLEKPPLYYTVASRFGLLFGPRSDAAYRLGSTLFAVLTVLTVFHMERRHRGLDAAVRTTAILMSCWLYFELSRSLRVDTALVFFVALAMHAYLRWTDTRRMTDTILLGLAMGLAFMVKGLVGPGIVVVAILTDAIRRRDLGLLWRIRPFVLAGIAAAMILPWVAVLIRSGGWPFLHELIVVNNLMRFTGHEQIAAFGHRHGPLYYFMKLPIDMLPWSIVFLPALLQALRHFRENRYVSWFVGPFAVLCLAGTKRGVYLAPLYPAIAAMIGQWLGSAERKRWEAVLLGAMWVAAIGGCFAPFAGILLGRPVLGSILGVTCVLALAIILHQTVPHRRADLALVLAICVGMCGTSAVYYSYRKPDRDYLGFAREALSLAGEREITVLVPEQTFEGVLPLATGRRVREVGDPLAVSQPGLYIWSEGRPAMLAALERRSTVRVLLTRKVGQRFATLAEVVSLRPER